MTVTVKHMGRIATVTVAPSGETIIRKVEFEGGEPDSFSHMPLSVYSEIGSLARWMASGEHSTGTLMQTKCGKLIPDAHQIIRGEIKRRHESKCCECLGLSHDSQLHIDPTTGAPWFECTACGVTLDSAYA